MIERYVGDNYTIKQCVNYFHNLIIDELQSIKINCWVGGGSVKSYLASEPIYDIDVFFATKDDYNKVYSYLINDKQYFVIFESDNATKIQFGRKKVDLICQSFYPSATDCIQQYDFTIVMAAIDSGGLVYHKDFFIDLAKKSLVINTISNPLSTLKRLQKYIKRGYTASNQTLADIFTMIENGNGVVSSDNNDYF